MSEISVRLENVTLVREIQHEASLDLKRSVFNALRGNFTKPERRTVLRNVSLVVRKGERIGIIGPNGAGKSTLLKVIAGILMPTSGQVHVTGLVAPLIEIGAGFDHELSLIDNVVLYGVLLGIPRNTMTARAEAILAYAELEPYATAMVKTLSSGMLARLGFAVASDLAPDVLLIDEVLSVGDQHFRAKSTERIMHLWESGIACMIVSHDLHFISTSCDRVLCIEQGAVTFDGPPRPAVRFYLDTVEAMPS